MVWGLFPDKAMRCSVQYVLEVVGIKLKLLLDEDVVMMLDCVPFTYDLRHVWSNVMKTDVLSGKVLLNEIESMVKDLCHNLQHTSELAGLTPTAPDPMMSHERRRITTNAQSGNQEWDVNTGVHMSMHQPI